MPTDRWNAPSPQDRFLRRCVSCGFHSTLERMHKRGWRVEILSWRHSCNQRMRHWAERHGVFVALDEFYDAITFMIPSRPGFEFALGRPAAALDLSRRPLA